MLVVVIRLSFRRCHCRRQTMHQRLTPLYEAAVRVHSVAGTICMCLEVLWLAAEHFPVQNSHVDDWVA